MPGEWNELPARARRSSSFQFSFQPEFAFGVAVKRPPERPVDDNHGQAHHRDPKHDAMEITRLCRGGNVRAKAVGFQALVSPGGNFRDDCPCSNFNLARSMLGDPYAARRS